ncbi:hypothetical protein PENTCL1PPCAC_15119, partial [Pristionchus entomophagus]
RRGIQQDATRHDRQQGTATGSGLSPHQELAHHWMVYGRKNQGNVPQARRIHRKQRRKLPERLQCRGRTDVLRARVQAENGTD